jgi:hypothetical protein
MRTFQECVKAYDDNIPHKPDVYMLGFVDAVAFIFGKSRTEIIHDCQEYRRERNIEEEEA